MTAAQCSAGIKRALDKMREAAQEATEETANEIFQVSTQNYCPVDTGLLKSSAKNEVVDNSANKYSHRISYNTHYAIYVHEIPIAHYNPPSAQWKYLETPFKIYAAKFPDKLKLEASGLT